MNDIPVSPADLVKQASAARAKGDMAAAIRALNSALSIDPDYVPALMSLASVARQAGRPESSVEYLEKVTLLRPDDVTPWVALGAARLSASDPAGAEEALRRALRIDPSSTAARLQMAALEKSRMRFHEAGKHYTDVLAAKGEDAGLQSSLGEVLLRQGRQEDAAMAFRKALEIGSDSSGAWDRVWGKAWGGLIEATSCVDETGEKTAPVLDEWGNEVARRLAPKVVVHDNGKDPDRALLAGFLFSRGTAAVKAALPALLSRLDGSKLKAVVFADVAAGSRQMKALSAFGAEVVDVRGKDDAAVAKLVKQAGIDVLIDLCGFSDQGLRVGVLAARPSPVQAVWGGIASGAGLDRGVWRFSDPVIEAGIDKASAYTGKPAILESGIICIDGFRNAPEVVEAPVFKSQTVTFGSFSPFARVNEAMMGRWADILRQVDRSRLLLKDAAFNDNGIRARVEDFFAGRGIGSNRIIFRGHIASHSDHLKEYGNVDVALDTFPVSGGVTTLEAAWMGVPVVTVGGVTPGSRVGSSVLERMGLKPLVADDIDDYVKKAVAIALRPKDMMALRRNMRRRMKASPVCDVDMFARSFEKTVRAMWNEWCLAPA